MASQETHHAGADASAFFGVALIVVVLAVLCLDAYAVAYVF